MACCVVYARRQRHHHARHKYATIQFIIMAKISGGRLSGILLSKFKRILRPTYFFITLLKLQQIIKNMFLFK